MPRTTTRNGTATLPNVEACANRFVCDEKRRASLVRQLQQVQRMLPNATMGAGLAHDLKNILTTIRLHSDLIAMASPGDGPFRRNLEYIGEAVKHANSLLDRLAVLARPHTRRVVTLRIDEEVAGTAAILQTALGPDVRLRVKVAPCGPVRMDRIELRQTLLNCAFNAKEAMGGHGTITVAAQPLELGAAASREFEPVLEPGSYVALTIRDTGPGIDASVSRSAAKPFHPSASPEGWGLGLTVVHGCAVRARGAVRIKNGKGGGACITIALPVAEQVFRTTERARGSSCSTATN